MKATISKESITKALSLTGGIVEKKQTLPILSNILIEFKDNSFKLVATDLESELTIIEKRMLVKLKVQQQPLLKNLTIYVG